eukprot:5951949-Pyramimonas_sp.AAC.1
MPPRCVGRRRPVAACPWALSAAGSRAVLPGPAAAGARVASAPRARPQCSAVGSRAGGGAGLP